MDALQDTVRTQGLDEGAVLTLKAGLRGKLFRPGEEAYDGAPSPQSLGGSPVSILLYVEDVDRVFGQAIAAGATVLTPVKDQSYGDRSGGVTDPFGHTWFMATDKEDVSPEEMRQRAVAAGQG